MNSTNTVVIAEEEKTYPGYLFSQYILKRKDSEEELALLSIMERGSFRFKVDTVNSNIAEFDDYLSELEIYNPDEFFEILKGIGSLLSDVFTIKFCPLLHATIPYRDRESGIIGTLSDNPYEEATFLWSLVEIK